MKRVKCLSLMTMVIVGVGAFGSIHEAGAAEKNATTDSAYAINKAQNAPSDAGFSDTRNEADESGKAIVNAADNTIKSCRKSVSALAEDLFPASSGSMWRR